MRILVWLWLGAAWAHADTSSAEALRHFEEGKKLFHLGAFYRAVEEYKLAYKAKPDPSFLYDSAQALRLAGEFEHALFFYRSFLSADPRTPLRREVAARIVHLEQQLRAQRAAALEPPTGMVAPNLARAAPSPDPPTPTQPTHPATAMQAATTATLPAQLSLSAKAPKRRWWPWVAGAAVVVVAVGVGLGVGLGLGNDAPRTQQGTIRF